MLAHGRAESVQPASLPEMLRQPTAGLGWAELSALSKVTTPGVHCPARHCPAAMLLVSSASWLRWC